MTKPLTLGVLALVVSAGPLAAQNARLAQAQPPRFNVPLCGLKPNHSKVDKGLGQLRKAYDAKTPADRTRALADADSLLVESITKDGQQLNAAAWYYLARVGLMQGDARKADSGFTKAQELNATCELDIGSYRQNNWAALANAGLEFQGAGKTDSALAYFREASILFQGLPHVFSNMGVVFANSGHNDSAAVYFAKALAIAEPDTSLVEDRNGSALNLAIMQQRLQQWPEAIRTLRQYLTWDPTNTEAQKSLAQSFRAAGMVDSATALEMAMVAEFSKKDLDSLDLGDLMAVGVAEFNAQRYPQAEAAFLKAVKRNPWSRDARYNLTNVYLAVQNHQRLVEEANELLKIEPMSEDALRLLGQGQRGLKQNDLVMRTGERLIGLPFSIEISNFGMGQSGARLTGEAVGRSAMDARGNPLPVKPVTLVVEFVDPTGKVVATKEVTIPVLKEGVRHAIELEATGDGITGWRYQQKA